MIVIKNPMGPEPFAPRRPDGAWFRFEMVFGGWALRAYADTPGELCAALISGYEDLTDDEARLTARITHAVTEQVHLQAYLNTLSDPAASTAAERRVLRGPRHVPPAIERWGSEVPLVLVDSFHDPSGPLPRPAGTPGADGEPDGNLVWLSPATEEAYLRSLAGAGVIGLADLELVT